MTKSDDAVGQAIDFEDLLEQAWNSGLRELCDIPKEQLPYAVSLIAGYGFKYGYRAGATSIDRVAVVPLDVVLFCPKCKAQHIDKAEPDKCESCGHPESEHFGHKFDDPDDIGCYACGGITKDGCQYFTAWLNPPHKKHRCHSCNHVWKPATIQTNGVAVIEEMEKGK